MAAAPLADAPTGVDQEAWDAACAAVRSYCGWHVAPALDDTVTVDGSGSQFVMLPTLRINSISEVTEDASAVTSYEWSESGQLWRSSPWSGHFRGITVAMNHGYEECPADILGVLREAASRGVTGSAVSQVGQVRMGGVSGVPGAASFLMEQTAVLDRYKLPARP